MKDNADEISILLLTEDYPIKPFDCEDEDLNDFLFNEAVPYRKELLATTFVMENDKQTLGYYSLLNDSLQLKEEMFTSKSQFRKFLRELMPYPKRHLKTIPALKIGRLAIDKTFKGKGLGSVIMANIISKCIKMNQEQACRLITVDAYKQAVPFYQKMGFKFLIEGDKDDTTRLMFLDLTSFI
ncbi:GNAT family N-acetyltransferase [Capnocytophaga leadbetteri]